ncbi:MAG: ATP-binding protein, partial [Sciscionella sp.]
GIGKSRLVAEALADPEVASRTILLGHCDPLREPFPFGAVLAALRMAGPALSSRPTLTPITGTLRSLLPELAAYLPARVVPVADAESERHHIFRAVRSLLGALGPTVLVVEDLHWADEGCRQLLRYLVADLPEALSLLVTLREEEASRLLSADPVAMVGVPLHRLRLGPLSVAETGQLASSMLGHATVSTEFATRLTERSAGIPFVVEETVRAIAEPNGVISADPARIGELLDGMTVPASLRVAIAERLAILAPQELALVAATSVLGVPSTLQTMAAVGQVRKPAAAAALRGVVESGVLREAAPGHYFLRHFLAAQAVYDTIDLDELATMHSRAMHALAAVTPPPLVRIAEHARRAGLRAEWVGYARRGVAAARQIGDLPSACILLRGLLENTILAPDDVCIAASEFAEVAAEGLDFPGAVRALGRLIADERLSATVRGEVRAAYGLLLIRQYDTIAEGREQLALAVTELDDSKAALRGRCLTTLASPTLTAEPLQGHRYWMRRVDAQLRETSGFSARLALQANHLGARLHIGDPSVWRDIEALPSSVSDPADMPLLARCYTNLADAAAYTGYPLRGRQFVRRAVALVEELGGYPHLSAALESTSVRLDWLCGDWSQLARDTECGAGRYSDLLPVLSELCLVAGMHALATGDSERARAQASRVQPGDELDCIAPIEVGAYCLRLRLRLRLRSGGEEHAAIETTAIETTAIETAVLADEAIEWGRVKGVWAWLGELCPLVALAYLQADRRGDAENLLAEMDQRMRGVDTPMGHSAILLCRALLAVACGHYGAARAEFECAAAVLSEHGLPYFALQAKESALCMGLAGGESSAAAALADCAERFELLGAHWEARRCRIAGKLAPAELIAGYLPAQC